MREVPLSPPKKKRNPEPESLLAGYWSLCPTIRELATVLLSTEMSTSKPQPAEILINNVETNSNNKQTLN